MNARKEESAKHMIEAVVVFRLVCLRSLFLFDCLLVLKRKAILSSRPAALAHLRSPVI
jgi:hypothetical protein